MVGVISGADGEKDSGSVKVCIQHSSGHGDGLAFNAGKSIDKERRLKRRLCEETRNEGWTDVPRRTELQWWHT